MPNETWVVITRHPDYGNETTTVCGPPIHEVHIDLGADFDTTPDDKEMAEQFFFDVLSQTEGAPKEVVDFVVRELDEYRSAWEHLWRKA